MAEPIQSATNAPAVGEEEPFDPFFDEALFDDRNFVYPSLPWRDIVPGNTFLWEYMMACSPDDLPEEYHFWNGLVAIGMALGRQTTLYDRIPVMGNMFVCTVGASGSGKSRAMSHLHKLIDAALPWDFSDPDTRGCKPIATPSSAEVLIHSFTRKLAPDPSKPTELEDFPVKGMVEFSELAGLVGKMSRQGNVMGPALIDFYDSRQRISTNSMTNKEQTAIEPFCSIVSTTQLRSIKTLLTQQDAASGFLNRWFFSMGPAKQRIAIGGAIIDVTPAVEPLKNISGWAANIKMINWTPAGLALFIKFWTEQIEPVREADQNDMMTRVDLLCKKLVLLFAANSHESLVSEATVQRVIDIFPYILQSYHAIDDRVGITEEHEISRAIVEVIRHLHVKNKKAPSMREIKLWVKSKKYTDERLVRAMQWLLKVETIEEVPPTKTAGRPAIRYQLTR